LSSEQVHRIKWHRKPELITPTLSMSDLTVETGHYLLFPAVDAEDIQDVFNHTTQSPTQPITQLWVIDGTWQEAQKMLRQSPWLKSMPKVQIQATNEQPLKSQFQLRRNQQGLCTLEAIATAVAHQSPLAAQTLEKNFHLFQNTLLSLLR